MHKKYNRFVSSNNIDSKRLTAYHEDLHTYATPDLIKFKNKNLESQKAETEILLQCICNNLIPTANNKYLQSNTVYTTSKPIDKLYLLRCKDAYVTGTYGIHDSGGFPFWNTIISRGDSTNNITYPRGMPERIDLADYEGKDQIKEALYINYLQCKNFGHLLTETASSIYPILQWIRQNSKYAQIPIIINEFFSSQDFQIEAFMELSGIPRDQIIIIGKDAKSIRAQNLYLSYPTHANRRYVSKKHPKIVKTLLKFSEKSLKNKKRTITIPAIKDKVSEKIFISRSQLSPQTRHLMEEKELERLLQIRGWKIYHPQAYSMSHQKTIYETAKFISATEGSALHLLYRCNLTNLKKIILLSKKEKNNYTLQFKAQRLNFTNITCMQIDPNCNKEKTCRNVSCAYVYSKEARIYYQRGNKSINRCEPRYDKKLS